VVVAPTLPTDDPTSDLERFVEGVGPQRDAVVVGHSFGGVVVPLIEARVHVYLCAIVPRPGRPVSELFSEALAADFGGTERDELGRSYWPSVDVAATNLYRGHDRQWAEWAFPQLRSQAQTAASEPHPLTGFAPTPVAYILAREDPAVRPEWSLEVARDTLGVEPLVIAGSHFPMFDRPVELADLLERVLERSA
jgi:pimeloyl-ACP methyl ester carboxylesterase